MNDILFLGVNDWDTIQQRPQHLARRLAAEARVIYVDPIGYSWLTHLQRSVRPSVPPRVGRPRLQLLQERLWRFTPAPALPFSRSLRTFNRLNHRWLAAQLRPVLRRLEITHPILWIAFPTGVDLIGRIETSHVIFDCLDDYPNFFHGRPQAQIATMEKELLSRADLVLATARPLLEKCRLYNTNAHLVTNGADLAHFARARQIDTDPPELQDHPHPRFGYIGTISDWTDIAALRGIAEAAPEGRVVIIGPWQIPVPADLPSNVLVLGPRPYEQLPTYLAGLDVALIPFIPSPLTQAVNPVKLFEYAAADLPIVATATDEMQHYADWCRLADSSAAFVTAALQAWNDRHTEQDRLRRERARSAVQVHDWDARMAEIRQLITRLSEKEKSN